MTDVEYALINTELLTTNVYNQTSYDEISKVLAYRESISNMQDRLTGYFKSKGYDVTTATAPKSNIFIGSVLE